jgi:hypothetical protein
MIQYPRKARLLDVNAGGIGKVFHAQPGRRERPGWLLLGRKRGGERDCHRQKNDCLRKHDCQPPGKYGLPVTGS